MRYEGLIPEDVFPRGGRVTTLLRGLAAAAGGVLLTAWESPPASAAVIIFGSCAVFRGAMLELESMLALSRRKPWGFQVSLAAVSLAAGILALGKPDMSPIAVLYLFSAWMVATGAMIMAWGLEIVPVVRLGRLKALEGAVAMAAGFLLMLFPDSGIPTTALALGMVLLLLGMAESSFFLFLRIRQKS